MARATGADARSSRLKIFGAIGLIGVVLIGVGLWWLMFRDTSAASVDSAEAEAARAEAIAEAVTGDGDATSATTDEAGADADDAYNDEPDSNAAQPDAAASAGNAVAGVWTVDTSIGTFGDACLEQACGTSFVGFRINEELAGFGAKTVVGRTPGVSGQLQIEGTQIIATDIVADMTQMLTDDPGRTGALKSASGGLDTSNFPEARFTLTQPIELGSPPVEGASVAAEAVGDLTVHGVTRQVTIPLTAELQPGVVVVVGSLVDIQLADFEIPKPTSVVVLSVEEVATMELQLFFTR